MITLTFPSPKDKAKGSPSSLTLLPEAVRALQYVDGSWYLYASGVDPMTITKYRLTQEALAQATRDAQGNPLDRDLKPLAPEDGKGVLEFIMTAQSVRVELVESAGTGLMFPGLRGGRPGPDVGMNPPTIGR